MALEMKVPKEITAYEAKPMFGLSWRRLGSLVFMVVVGGGVFAAIAFAIATPQDGTKAAWEQATNVAMFAMFAIDVPAAWWGWFRPMGLKPEIHAQYFLRFHFLRRVIPYVDTYLHRNRKPVHQPAEQPVRRSRADARAQARARRTLSEHQEEARPASSRRAARPRRTNRH
ncbi:PrgI family protein (plasmid) [Leifsonia sp. ZF2019]|uniref:PrgI family protein n=1 Tax=Leifsonia sp. ZF2019 TaxID=2781978 RepID=UPI001CBB954A|nr:PrgI family protein [Leifsonia sp. ZF2019]UAJ81703.1 PrgI family protein [Leifsonia sp. ZF2019]